MAQMGIDSMRKECISHRAAMFYNKQTILVMEVSEQAYAQAVLVNSNFLATNLACLHMTNQGSYLFAFLLLAPHTFLTLQLTVFTKQTKGLRNPP